MRVPRAHDREPAEAGVRVVESRCVRHVAVSAAACSRERDGGDRCVLHGARVYGCQWPPGRRRSDTCIKQVDVRSSSMRFVCPRCGATAEADPRVWRCWACGSALELAEAPISLDERLEGDGVWRYSPWLGIDRGVSLGEPTTPLVQVDWHGAAVTLKLEGALPTGSFKDRGAAVLVTLLRDSSVRHVADDSSGNAGAALAAYCARAGIACDIYAPAAASAAKLAQIAFYGARTITVPGARSAATDALLEASAD